MSPLFPAMLLAAERGAPTTVALLLGAIAALGGLVPAGLTLARLLRRLRRVQPQPDPPPRLRPGVAGAVYAGTVRPEHVAATLIDLAARAHLRIEPSPEGDTWLLTRTGGAVRELRLFEGDLLRSVFATGNTTTVRALAARAGFGSAVHRVMRGIWRDAYARGLVPESRRMPGAYCLLAAGFLICGTAAFLIRLDGTGWIAGGFLVAALAVAGTARLRSQHTTAGVEAYARLRGHRAYLAGLPRAEWRPGLPAYAVALNVHRDAFLEFDGTDGTDGAEEAVGGASLSTDERFARDLAFVAPDVSFGDGASSGPDVGHDGGSHSGVHDGGHGGGRDGGHGGGGSGPPSAETSSAPSGTCRSTRYGRR
ncbi:MAG: DUF2207 domain-containing protein [Streptosporangiales bacterium]|nr:DUF2207 domain-containing protein [Streptosporangiales bacterium]